VVGAGPLIRLNPVKRIADSLRKNEKWDTEDSCWENICR